MPARKPSKQSTPPETFDFACPHCAARVQVTELGQVTPCPACHENLGRVAQLDQLLARWYEPRRWRADLVKPSVPYLVERLWTTGGQGERLYLGVGPKYTNYDIFRHLITRLMIEGIDAGWAQLTFPADPFSEDPQYVLTIVDSERFANGVEKLFPEVNWDEPVPAVLANALDLPPPRRKSTRGKRR